MSNKDKEREELLKEKWAQGPAEYYKFIGSLGAEVRNQNLTATERKRLARRAIKTRWRKAKDRGKK